MRLLSLCVLAAACACRAPAVQDAPPRPNVLLITIDTLRWDALERGVSPTLVRLGIEGLSFDEARTVAPLTLPAHASIMTGLLPPAHGLRLNGAGRLEGHPTLAADFKAAGYATRAVVGAFVLDRRFGLDAGFEEYDDRIARDPTATDRLEAERPAAAVVQRATELIDGVPAGRPWFLWVHFYDAHAPYEPPPDARARAGGDGYGGEVAYIDAEVARLLAYLDRRGATSRTAIMVAGDHGESLGEHGEPTHGMLLFEGAVRIPLLLKAPGVPAEPRFRASLIDIAPTLRAVAGIEGAKGPGRNLAGPPNDDDEGYMETEYPTVAGWTPVRALVRDRFKLIEAGSARLFDLQNDPGEQTDISSLEPMLARSMAARLEELRTSGGTAPAAGAALPADTAARLRSLGYVAAAPQPRPAGAPGVDPASVMPAWASFETALAEVQAAQYERALPALARLSQEFPDASLFAATYARALAAAGRSREALTRYRAAVAKWPGDWSLYHELAVTARDHGLADEALKAEEAALTLAPKEPMALNGKGLILADAGGHGEAARAFEAATAADPTNAVYLANLGNAKRAMGDLAAATQAYRQALDRNPDLGDAANGLGVVLVQSGQPSEAVRWLELAARDDAFVEAQLNLGIALQQSGDRRRAAAQYRKVLAAPARFAGERDAARNLLAQLEPR